MIWLLVREDAKNTNGYIASGEQHESDVRTENASRIQVSNRTSKLIDRIIVNHRRKNGDERQDPAGQELREDDLPIAQRLGHQQLNGAIAVLFCKEAHCDCRT